MATFRITHALSRLTTGAEPAYDQTVSTADTVILDQDAYLISTKSSGAHFLGFPKWTITINGTVFGDFSGLLIGAKASVTVGAEGEVSGFTGVDIQPAPAWSGPITLKNAGNIVGEVNAISVKNTGVCTLTNTGRIEGGENAYIDKSGLSIDKITNAAGGLMLGDVQLDGGNDTLVNSGLIVGDIILGDGNDVMSGTGGLSGSVFGGIGNDTVSVTNADKVDLGIGDDKLTIAKNGGSKDIIGDEGNDTIVNAGFILQSVTLGAGINALTNSGTIKGVFNGGDDGNTIKNTGTIDASVSLGGGIDKVTNSGTIAGLFTGGGNDVVTSSGTISSINLGAGDDKYTSTGKAFDFFTDAEGTDTVSLGPDGDSYHGRLDLAGDGIDVLDGGTGDDTYALHTHKNSVRVNLDTVAHDNSPFSNDGAIAAGSAVGSLGTDKLKNFEHVWGGEGDDFIYGSAAANTLSGFEGIDSLYGLGGNDILSGGDGADGLVGGAGQDTMIGGEGADFFVLLSTKDSGITKTTRDTISDFEDGIDTIHLSFIDANTKNGAATNDKFTYVNADSSVTPAAIFSGAPGDLRSYWTVNGHIIEGDVNGDKKADFSILVEDPTHAIVLTSADFVL